MLLWKAKYSDSTETFFSTKNHFSGQFTRATDLQYLSGQPKPFLGP